MGKGKVFQAGGLPWIKAQSEGTGGPVQKTAVKSGGLGSGRQRRGLDSFFNQGQEAGPHPTRVSKGHCHRVLLRGHRVWSVVPGLRDGSGMALCQKLPLSHHCPSWSEGSAGFAAAQNKLQLPKLRAWPCGKANSTLMTSKHLEKGPRGASRSQWILTRMGKLEPREEGT